MADANAITARALNFGLDNAHDASRTAAELVASADHDRRVLRKVMGRVERGCQDPRTPVEEWVLLVLSLALAGGYRAKLGLVDSLHGRDSDHRLTTAVQQ